MVKISQHLKAIHRSIQKEQHKKMTDASSQRKAENRTKIQLGGLILKSGLADLLGIVPGADLQRDVQEREKTTILLGALLEASETFLEDKQGEVHHSWSFKGQKAMTQDIKPRKW